MQSSRRVPVSFATTAAPSKGFIALGVAVFGLLGGAGMAQAQNLLPVDATTLTCDLVTFDDLEGTFPGLNVDGVLAVPGATLAERFSGQGLVVVDGFDELTGSPGAPLSLQAGSAGANLNVLDLSFSGDNVLGGLSDAGLSSFGQGSVAILFGEGQSAFGLDFISGSASGTALLSFFRSDGSLIEATTLNDLQTNDQVAFERAGGIADIAGVSIENEGFSGVGIDNLCFQGATELEIAIESRLLEGPAEFAAKAQAPTVFTIEIAYSGPDALVVDTVPETFEVSSCTASAGDVAVRSLSRKAGRGATRLEWAVPEGVNDVECMIETRSKPGKGPRNKTPWYQPASCGPVALNAGATAYERDPLTGALVYVEQIDPDSGLPVLVPAVVAGPSEARVVHAVRPGKPCEDETDGAEPSGGELMVLRSWRGD